MSRNIRGIIPNVLMAGALLLPACEVGPSVVDIGCTGSILMYPPDKVTIAVGSTQTAAVAYRPCESSMGTAVNWVIADSSIARLTVTSDTTATITGLKAGQTVGTAKGRVSPYLAVAFLVIVTAP